jgi:hypothetical protein
MESRGDSGNFRLIPAHQSITVSYVTPFRRQIIGGDLYRDKLRAKLEEIKVELHRRMHQPIPVQGSWLGRVVTGHFAYYAVPIAGHGPNGRDALERVQMKAGFFERLAPHSSETAR